MQKIRSFALQSVFRKNAVFTVRHRYLRRRVCILALNALSAVPAYTYPLAAVPQADLSERFNFNLFLLCLQAAVLLCFIFWCVDLVSEKINGRKL